jgi:hypothetical protein
MCFIQRKPLEYNSLYYFDDVSILQIIKAKKNHYELVLLFYKLLCNCFVINFGLQKINS